jgi:hypothetical protein
MGDTAGKEGRLMAHHKRKRPKSRRAGCLLCKPHKANGASLKSRDAPSDRRRMQGEIEADDLDAGLRRYDEWARSTGAQ